MFAFTLNELGEVTLTRPITDANISRLLLRTASESSAGGRPEGEDDSVGSAPQRQKTT